MKKVGKKGFSMIEVLIVIAIIAVLAGTVIPIVSRYIEKGKNDYNEKLSNQLLVSGKNYYSDNKSLLPGPVLGSNYAFVTVPEMQSKNYISKDFVDADKNDCKLSYVFVEDSEVKGEDYEWTPCLICGEGADAKVYGDTEKCNIGNMNNEKAPICTNEAVFTGGTKNDAGMFVNPVSVTLKGLSNVDANKKGRIVITKDSVKTVEIGVKDVSKLVNNPQKISNLVTPAIACEEGKICEYEIKVRAGAIKSEEICGKFIIDTRVPRCEFDYDGNNKYKPELIKLSLLENVEGLSGKILIVKEDNELKDSSNDYADLSQGKTIMQIQECI